MFRVKVYLVSYLHIFSGRKQYKRESGKMSVFVKIFDQIDRSVKETDRYLFILVCKESMYILIDI